MNAVAEWYLTCSRRLRAAADAATNEEARADHRRMAASAYDRYLQAMEEGPEDIQQGGSHAQ